MLTHFTNQLPYFELFWRNSKSCWHLFNEIWIYFFLIFAHDEKYWEHTVWHPGTGFHPPISLDQKQHYFFIIQPGWKPLNIFCTFSRTTLSSEAYEWLPATYALFWSPQCSHGDLPEASQHFPAFSVCLSIPLHLPAFIFLYHLCYNRNISLSSSLAGFLARLTWSLQESVLISKWRPKATPKMLTLHSGISNTTSCQGGGGNLQGVSLQYLTPESTSFSLWHELTLPMEWAGSQLFLAAI